uniref:Uncharacterized protein n=1 Tax=Rhizophora mucronata TaxID=61149 RepID=A0A2P2LZ13_RHIMU
MTWQDQRVPHNKSLAIKLPQESIRKRSDRMACTGMSPFASISDQHSVSVSNAHTEILSLGGLVFPPIRSAFFPQETRL